MKVFQLACAVPFLQKLFAGLFQSGNSDQLHTEFVGLQFKNPVGLGAGFDKNAQYLEILETLGFGFVEIGTVTPRPQRGNEKPRLFRLPEEKALINRMGFNNEGVQAVANRLKKWRSKPMQKKHAVPMLVGGNIGKNKVTANEEAWKDYEICFRALHPYVDFFVVNVSSPNTPGLRALQEKEALKKILLHLQETGRAMKVSKPILLKIAPDLEMEALQDIINLVQEINLDGLVVSNTTISRKLQHTKAENIERIGAGGLSGLPLEERATDLVQYIHHETKGRVPIIGSGGIFTGKDAERKLKAGAGLIEVWTGFIYEGPFIVKKLCTYLLSKKQGLNN